MIFMKKILLWLTMLCMLALCLSCNRNANLPGTESIITPTVEQAEEPTPTVEPTVAPVNTRAVRIGVIDSGLSSYVINPDNIELGRNLIFPEQDTEDRIGHGTACAAFIVGSEPARIEGNCPEALLVPLVYADVFIGEAEAADAAENPVEEAAEDAAGSAASPEPGEQVVGGTELLAEAIYDAVDAYDCDIVLISSGTTKDDSPVHDAVSYAYEHGVIVVACAGNSGNTDPEAVFYPGAYPEVVCVGSLDSDGGKAVFSQDNEYVDVWEIGTDLRLATLKGTRIRGSGTSYSAAIAAGRIASYICKNPDMTVAEVLHGVYPDRY